MRSEDRARFAIEIDPENATRAEEIFDRVLGIEVSIFRDLEGAILEDLDPENFGISWWKSHLTPALRIYISDYLVELAPAVRTNFIEAHLHVFEALDALQSHEQRISRIVGVDGRPRFPSAGSPADLLPEKQYSLHVGGVMRALGSTLDCLAGLIVGVFAIPLYIIKADFSRTLQWLRGERERRQPRHLLHHELIKDLERWISTAGPPGWVEWVDGYRNMLVHRARRLEIFSLRTQASILDLAGRPIPRAELVPLLTKAPQLSNVEALRQGGIVLTEDARQTLAATIESVEYVARKLGDRLMSVWKHRRENPKLLLQPAQQWPSATHDRAEVFDGYEPASVSVSHNALLTGPTWEKRLIAAALTDELRRNWEEFDK